MKRIIAAIVTLSFTSSILASEGYALNALDRAPRAMIYFHQPIGAAPGKDSELQFGLRLESSPTQFGGADLFASTRPASPIALTDIRFRRSGEYQFWTHGGLMYDSMEGVIGTGDSWSAWWWWVMLGIAAGGVSCLTDNWPCEDSYSNGSYTPPPSTPGS